MVKDFTKVSMDIDLAEIFRTRNFGGKNTKQVQMENPFCLRCRHVCLKDVFQHESYLFHYKRILVSQLQWLLLIPKSLSEFEKQAKSFLKARRTGRDGTIRDGMMKEMKMILASRRKPDWMFLLFFRPRYLFLCMIVTAIGKDSPMTSWDPAICKWPW